MSDIPQATIDGLKKQHGDIFQLSFKDSVVVVRSPSRGEFQKWQDAVADERKRKGAIDNLLYTCIVYPDTAGLEAMLEKRPGLVTTFGSQLLEIAGLSQEVEKKEL